MFKVEYFSMNFVMILELKMFLFQSLMGAGIFY